MVSVLCDAITSPLDSFPPHLLLLLLALLAVLLLAVFIWTRKKRR